MHPLVHDAHAKAAVRVSGYELTTLQALERLKAADAKKERALSPTELVAQRLQMAAAAAANAAAPLANNISSFTSAAAGAVSLAAMTSQLQVAQNCAELSFYSLTSTVVSHSRMSSNLTLCPIESGVWAVIGSFLRMWRCGDSPCFIDCYSLIAREQPPNSAWNAVPVCWKGPSWIIKSKSSAFLPPFRN